MNPKRLQRQQKYRQTRRAAVNDRRKGIVVLEEVEYDPTAPTLTRIVPGLVEPRVRTVSINGYNLTINEVG